VPGKSHFRGVDEVLPGELLRSDGSRSRLWSLAPSGQAWRDEAFEACFMDVVRDHEASDVRNVALLSGGIDSSLVLACSQVSRAYSVGLPDQHEFTEAADTARLLQRDLQCVTLSAEAVETSWRTLTRLRGEPLSVPNEALIHGVCMAMQPQEKVVLTGEGADELMFGYDRLCRWALQAQSAGQGVDWPTFWALYGYAGGEVPERLQAHMADLARGKGALDFVEDMLYTVHLPGLLRRMDFAAMAASREARVPFADRRLVQLCYRQPAAIKLDAQHSKLPLRRLLSRLGVEGPLGRPKIGFAVQTTPGASRQVTYQHFQDVVLQELSWS
jgi:asparagine synthase (glutamine-hydrolysing)